MKGLNTYPKVNTINIKYFIYSKKKSAREMKTNEWEQIKVKKTFRYDYII